MKMCVFHTKCIRAPISISSYYILIATLSYLWCKMFGYMLYTVNCFCSRENELFLFLLQKGRKEKGQIKLQDVECCLFFVVRV